MAAGHGVLAKDDAGLWEALAEGGKVVMMRHTQSEDASAEVSMHLAEDGDCSAEQNLSAEGREQAEALGAQFREHGVTVDAVLSSEFCRARQTAELMFGEDYQSWNALNLAEVLPASEAEWLMEDVRERIGDFSGEGNLVMVSHRSNINTITFQQTEPGDMVVAEPDDFGGFTVLGTIVRQ
ncbi:MAG: histidine phosphatase family protein [Thioalkalivibrio sp.]|nr:histidine phosphatase family protein [Thioalkalivibrio sp.]